MRANVAYYHSYLRAPHTTLARRNASCPSVMEKYFLHCGAETVYKLSLSLNLHTRLSLQVRGRWNTISSHGGKRGATGWRRYTSQPCSRTNDLSTRLKFSGRSCARPLCLFDNRLAASICRGIEASTNKCSQIERYRTYTLHFTGKTMVGPHCTTFHCLFLSSASSGLCLFTCHRSRNYHSRRGRPFVRTHSRRVASTTGDRRWETWDRGPGTRDMRHET